MRPLARTILPALLAAAAAASIAALLLPACAVAAPAKAAPPAKAAAPKAAPKAAPVATSSSPLAPHASGEMKSAHNPFSEGECGFCHVSKDPANPGALQKPINQLCYGCHEDYAEQMKVRKVKHRPVADNCTNCHNPHNSPQRALLLKETAALCLGCHDPIKEDANAKVKHQPVVSGKQCVNCHNPHSSEVQALLLSLPYDLCVKCHGVDGLQDESGARLGNIKKILDENPSHHGPITKKDCSACHQPHGSENFRLLVQPYPEKFYAPYDPANYKLCFECHNPEIAKTERTTTLTRFRDGDRNLHYLHINREKGRTCRACHEVHASKQAHQIREAVPYGTTGWMLKVNYVKTETGGSCAKTCHATKTYDNSQSAAASK